MMPLRIAFFVPSFPELSETFLLRQITGLLDRGHDVRILAHNSPTTLLCHPEVRNRDLVSRTRYLARKDRSAGKPPGKSRTLLPGPWRVSPLRLASAFLTARSWDLARNPGRGVAAAYRVVSVAREDRPHLVHCHYGDTALQYGFAANLWQVPLVVSFYGYDISELPRRSGRGVYHRLLNRADRVLVLSEEMRDTLLGLGAPAERVEIHPLSVDPETFRPNPAGSGGQKQCLRILTVGRLVPKKGVEFALRAFALLAKEFRDLEYEIVGAGPLAADLRALAHTLGVSDRVRFMGPLAEPDVAEAMRRADVFLLPSVTADDGDREGTPTVLLEAQSSGLPVVATRHAGIPEIVRDGESGILVEERDVQGLLEALRVLLRDTELRRALGIAGRAFVVSHHSVAAAALRLEKTYTEFLGAEARAGGGGAA